MDPIIQKIIDSQNVDDILNNKSFKANSLESVGLAISASFLKENKNIAIVTPSLYEAQNLSDFISNFIDSKYILYFPYDEILRGDLLYSSKEFLKERIHALANVISNNTKHILILNSISLLHVISSLSRFKTNIISIKKGDVLPPKQLINKLINLGYSRVNKVEEVFEFSIRGEIVDIFTPNNSNPYRLEYFDDEIEDIREFNATSELSFKNIDSIKIIPAIENIFTKEELDAGISKIKDELNLLPSSKLNDELKDKINFFIEQVNEDGYISQTKERLLPYFIESKTTILDYLKDFSLYFYRFNDVQSTANNYTLEAIKYISEMQNDFLSLKKESLSLSLEETIFQKPDFLLIEDESSNLDVTSIPYAFSNINSSTRLIDQVINDGYDTYIYLKDDQLTSFQQICNDNSKTIDLSNNNLGYQVILGRSFNSGFLLPKLKLGVISSREIFGINDASSIFLKRFKEAKIITKYQDLSIGDYVVHEQQGIGRYLGIKTFQGLEYLNIEYAGKGQYLLVPLNKFNLIRKYSSKEGTNPKLDTLGGASWARRKAKIRGRVSYLADKLIEIAAYRNSLPGFKFQEDDEFEKRFADAFMYHLTPSQEKAWSEIKKDMCSNHPMDRLLTGDVGFGKTELAFKAAFKCILSHKQAALLCPTTVLSNQHYQVAIKRFEGFGVNIALLNRNISSKRLSEILCGLKDGSIHFVIGTHRLLGDDVTFNDLGLLIVDEEQRFGVTHKEKIKELTTNIDVLTLTATPIPRTLQMSLLNVRSLSLLDNPPNNRLPIKTYVVKYDKNLIKEVISRELARKGQIYYLHNRITSMPKTIQMLEKMFPNKVIKGVHGQEEGEDISNTMEEFYSGKIDVLVCTSIIETGIDVANCNTIIIENAQNFGLSQLYQIKGRVGRSSKIAYAYLTYPDYSILTDEARKRLKALKSFTELGSGYKIANEDLNIRGAGDILGKEQAGFIDSLGYDAYIQLLNEVMQEKKLVILGQKQASKPIYKHYELSFSLDAHIPSYYASEHDRINLYRELYDITNLEELAKFKNKMIDVYGKFSEEIENLFIKKQVEIYLSSNEIFSDFKELMDRFDIKMSIQFSTRKGLSLKLEETIIKMQNKNIQVHFFSNYFKITLIKSSQYLLDLYNLVVTLIKLDESF